MADSVYAVTRDDPHNHRMLAQAGDELRYLLDVVVHDLVDQVEESDGSLASMLAVLTAHWIDDAEKMPRDRLAALLALALVMLAEGEREIVGPGRTARRVPDSSNARGDAQ